MYVRIDAPIFHNNQEGGGGVELVLTNFAQF